MSEQLRTPADVGAAIRARRLELAMDQATLARLAGVSRLWIVEMEQGKVTAAVGHVLRTIAALGMTIALNAQSLQSGLPVHDLDLPAESLLDDIIERARGKT